jgi:hypothetical protein
MGSSNTGAAAVSWMVALFATALYCSRSYAEDTPELAKLVQKPFGNVARPHETGDWTLRMQFQLQFPRNPGPSNPDPSNPFTGGVSTGFETCSWERTNNDTAAFAHRPP